MKSFNQYIEIVNKAIAEVILPASPAKLYEPISYTMSFGGKRLRPILTLMTCDACGTECAKAVNQAIGIEYFHNFTLLHDDVMDNADVRRGKPTVHCRWDENTAILSGDAMLTLATQLTARGAGEKLDDVLTLFNATAMEIYEGQQWDMDFESRNDVSADEYINMIRLKTSVLFGAACKMGALIAGASTDTQQALYDFGVNLGLAFQLQDDYLDVYGDPATFGKEIGGDILNAKKTFMLISAFNEANDTQRTHLYNLLSNKVTTRKQEKISGVTALYNELHIPEICNAKIGYYIDLSLSALEKSELNVDCKAQFVNFAEMLMNRKK